jgi:hypothetical protein
VLGVSKLWDHILQQAIAGSYYAYLWGEPLRRYFELPTAGHTLATNPHADTYEQARRQVCGENGVTVAAVRRMNLMCFLSVERTRTGLRANELRHVTPANLDDVHCGIRLAGTRTKNRQDGFQPVPRWLMTELMDEAQQIATDENGGGGGSRTPCPSQ